MFQPPEPKLELMARFTVELAPPAELGRTSGLGDRRISAMRLANAVIYDAYLIK